MSDDPFMFSYTSYGMAGLRLGKNVISETNEAIDIYNKALDDLKQQFLDKASLAAVVLLHDIGKETLLCELGIC